MDRDGEFYANADSLGFVDNKPNKQAVDRLVGDLRKAEDVRMRRRKGGDEEDVTYINDKNKQFNQKLARYYNKVCIPRNSEVCYWVRTDRGIVYWRNQRQFRERNYGLEYAWGLRSGGKMVMNFCLRFFVASTCGVMGKWLKNYEGGQ